MVIFDHSQNGSDSPCNFRSRFHYFWCERRGSILKMAENVCHLEFDVFLLQQATLPEHHSRGHLCFNFMNTALNIHNIKLMQRGQIKHD